MLMRNRLCLIVLGLVALTYPARLVASDTSTAPTLVVRIASLDGVLSDIKFLASVAGRDAEAKQLDDHIKQFLPNGFRGIDTKRPLGAYGTLDADGNLQSSTGAILVPISDEKAFLELLESLKLKLQKGEDGVYGKSEEKENPLYLRFANKYAYITIKEKASIAANKLLAPEKVLTLESAEVVSLSFRVDQVPQFIKQVALGQLDTRLSDLGAEQPANETAPQHAIKAQAAKEIGRHISALVNEGGTITVRLDLDRQAGKLALEMSTSAKPGSKLADGIAALANSQSLFAGLSGTDSAVNGLMHVTLPDSIRKTLGPIIDEGIRNGLEQEKDKTKRARAEKVLNALASTLKSGELDAAFDLRRPSRNQHFTLVAGIKIRDGAQLEQALRGAIGELPAEVRERIKLDAESAGGTKIHRLDIQKDLDAEARRNLGENPLYLAFRDDAVIVAGGEDGLKALQSALVAKPSAAPPVRFELSLARLAPAMAEKKGVDAQEAVKKAFGDGGKDNDKIRLAIEGGPTLKIRLDVSTAVIKFFSLIDQGNRNK
jgi:hypothetical protein